ncbi:MAG: VOC family protein [Myxococcota bacterium]
MQPLLLDHVAFGITAIEPVAAFLVGTLGGRERDVGPGGAFLWWQWEFEGGGSLEMLLPDGPPDGFLHRFLAMRGPGAHHVTFKVRDIHESLEEARSLGYTPVGFDDSHPSWLEAFLHPKEAQGIVVQLAESHPELSGEVPRQPFPTAPSPAPLSRVVGLRFAARSEARARKQWETLLGGKAASLRDGIAFSYPNSALRIAVQIDPSADEGPVALEVAAPHSLALPEGPHPLFGLPLVQIPFPPTEAPTS